MPSNRKPTKGTKNCIGRLPKRVRDHAFEKLGGHLLIEDPDGASEWGFEDAAAYFRKHGLSISPQGIRRWFDQRVTVLLTEHRFEKSLEMQLQFTTRFGERVDLKQLADAHITADLAKLLEDKEPRDIDVKVIRALATLKRVALEEDRLTQQIKEYEESTEALRAEITKLREFIEKGGTDGDLSRADNRALVAKVDEIMGLTVPKKTGKK